MTTRIGRHQIPSVAERKGLSDIRWTILAYIKRQRHGSLVDLADHLRISYEGVRQHVIQLEKEGWIAKESVRSARPGAAGRPPQRYALTSAGDHLFPKHYDKLTVEMVDALTQHLGSTALKTVLAELTETRVRQWEPMLTGKPLADRVQALRDIYLDGDPYMSVESDADGIRLVERNCPFLNVAMRRPALCSVTVNTLQRLLGVRVIREERFQLENGRCVFRIFPDRPIDPKQFKFRFEDDVQSAADSTSASV